MFSWSGSSWYVIDFTKARHPYTGLCCRKSTNDFAKDRRWLFRFHGWNALPTVLHLAGMTIKGRQETWKRHRRTSQRDRWGSRSSDSAFLWSSPTCYRCYSIWRTWLLSAGSHKLIESMIPKKAIRQEHKTTKEFISFCCLKAMQPIKKVPCNRLYVRIWSFWII